MKSTNRSVIIRTCIIALPITVATGMLGYHFLQIPTMVTCMTTSFILMAIIPPTLRHIEKPKVVTESHYILVGEHRYRRSDIDNISDGLMLIGRAGITIGEEKTVIDVEMRIQRLERVNDRKHNQAPKDPCAL